MAGNYFFYPGESIGRGGQTIESGPPYEKITFPEGFTSEQMAEVLEEKVFARPKTTWI